jgi:hypothetical protein
MQRLLKQAVNPYHLHSFQHPLPILAHRGRRMMLLKILCPVPILAVKLLLQGNDIRQHLKNGRGWDRPPSQIAGSVTGELHNPTDTTGSCVKEWHATESGSHLAGFEFELFPLLTSSALESKGGWIPTGVVVGVTIAIECVKGAHLFMEQDTGMTC